MLLKNHQTNKNLDFYYLNKYQGLPVMVKYSPMIEQYLERILNTLKDAQKEYQRARVFRFDLHIPTHNTHWLNGSSTLPTRFFRSLNAKIESKGKMTVRAGKRWHNTSVRYIWVKEYSNTGSTHYHVALIVNGDTLWKIGKHDLSIRNLYTLIHEAWASALSMQPHEVIGYIHIPDNPTYVLHREQPIGEAFFRLSYLAKAQTKYWGDQSHAFGCSRN